MSASRKLVSFDAVSSILRWKVSLAEALALCLPLSLLSNSLYTIGNRVVTLLIWSFACMTLIGYTYLSSRHTNDSNNLHKELRTNSLPEGKEANNRIYNGLKLYIEECFQEYLDREQMDVLFKDIVRVHLRKQEVSISDLTLLPVSRSGEIRSRTVQTKLLKKCNLYSFIHNMAGFLHLTRREAASLLKKLFPAVFEKTSVTSIDKSLTAEKDMKRLEIPYFPNNTDVEFEQQMINYINQQI